MVWLDFRACNAELWYSGVEGDLRDTLILSIRTFSFYRVGEQTWRGNTILEGHAVTMLGLRLDLYLGVGEGRPHSSLLFLKRILMCNGDPAAGEGIDYCSACPGWGR